MSVSLASLTQKRAKLRDEMLAMQRRAEESDPENAIMSPEMQTAFDQMKVALANLEASISNRSSVDAFERLETGRTITGGDVKFENAKRAFRMNVAIAGACGMRVDDGAEREISAEMARRSGKTSEGVLVPYEAFHRPVERRILSPTGNASGIVGTYLDETQYVDALRAAIVTARLGARYLTGLDTNIDLPRLSATATASWVLDGVSAPTDTAEAFNKISLRPHHVIGIVEFTRATLLTSTPSVMDAARNDLVAVLARSLDLAALNGSGTPDPFGILNTPGLTIVPGGTNGAALSWTNVLAAMEAAQLGNAPETNLGWASNPRVRAAGMGTLKFPGISGSMTIMDTPDALAGYAFSSTTQLPLNTKGTGTGLSTLLYGSWDELIIAMFGEGISVLVNPFSAPQFSSGNVQVRVICTADIAVKHIASFAALTDIIAP